MLVSMRIFLSRGGSAKDSGRSSLIASTVAQRLSLRRRSTGAPPSDVFAFSSAAPIDSNHFVHVSVTLPTDWYNTVSPYALRASRSTPVPGRRSKMSAYYHRLRHRARSLLSLMASQSIGSLLLPRCRLHRSRICSPSSGFHSQLLGRVVVLR